MTSGHCLLRSVGRDTDAVIGDLQRRLRSIGATGAVYPSVRRAKGQCLAAFTPQLLHNCAHAAYLQYSWNGHEIDAVFEF